MSRKFRLTKSRRYDKTNEAAIRKGEWPPINSYKERHSKAAFKPLKKLPSVIFAGQNRESSILAMDEALHKSVINRQKGDIKL